MEPGELLERGIHVEGTQVYLPPGSDVAQCWGFMLAVQQYSILADHDGKTLAWSVSKARNDDNAGSDDIR
jgi:hypothetical protein